MDKKTVGTAISTFLVALLAMAAVTFAWFTITYEVGTDPFVTQVGTLDATYEFSQIIEGEFKAEHQDGMFDNREVIPGSGFVFALIVRDEGDINGTISVDLTGVKSFNVLGVNDKGNYDASDVYTDPRQKIQYSFSYNVLNAYWIPNNGSFPYKDELDQNNPLPSDEDVDT